MEKMGNKIIILLILCSLALLLVRQECDLPLLEVGRFGSIYNAPIELKQEIQLTEKYDGDMPTAYCQEGIEYCEGYNIYPYKVVLIENGEIKTWIVYGKE